MTKHQARPAAASPAAKPASLARAEARPRPPQQHPSATAALPLFAMYFLGAGAGNKPGAVRGRKR